MSDTKQSYLMKFRKCSSFETLEKVFERLCEKNSGEKLYDKVPASVWTFVRE
ncbi:hypothetical protein [Escherichia coli]|uniref:hypothetical protein n=1 Tax=Escherichia coli TaxID=562 RepID=UPI000A365010